MRWTLAQIHDTSTGKLHEELARLMLLIEPRRLKPLGREARQNIWYDIKEIHRELKTRSTQGKLL